MVPVNTRITENPVETKEFGETVGAALLKSGGGLPAVLTLTGELGSGKTTFVQGLARGLGIRQRLISPTFVIVRRYGIPGTDRYLYHIDAYRLEGARDAETFGLPDMLAEPGSVIAIEWPERLGSAVPETHREFAFGTREDGSHVITEYENAT